MTSSQLARPARTASRGLSVLCPAALVAVLAAPLPAAAQIFQPGTQPVGETDGIVFPLDRTALCTRCHASYGPTVDPTVSPPYFEPWDSWRGTMMGNAGRDPVFRAALSIAEEDEPDAADFCVRCHSPPAWLRGRSSRPDYDPAAMAGDEPRFRPDPPPPMSPSDDLDGVSCISCHRLMDPTDAQIHNAQLVFADGDPDARVRRGPYSYTLPTAPHETVYEPFLSEGRFCGQCHDIHNPVHTGYRLEAGVAVPTGRPFAIERTFSEWRYSEFGDGDGMGDATCQGCHMPEVTTPAHAADTTETAFLRPEMSRHDLAGGSVWQPLALAEILPGDGDAYVPLFMASSTRARSMLESAATLEIVSSALAGGRATATVRVTNLTGHKLPTGYPEGRRMWLEVQVLDAGGAAAPGGSGLLDASGHLVTDAQVHTWESSLGERQPDGTVMPSFHFVANDVVMEDTRIPPAGFAPPVDRDMNPLGRDYSDGAGGYDDFDEASFDVPACGTGELTLRVRLRYQSTTAEYIEFLRDASPASLDPALMGRSWGDVAYDLWERHGGDDPVDMEVATVVLGAATMPCPTPDAGPPDVDAGSDGGLDAGLDAGFVDLDAGLGLDGGPPAAAPSNCGCSTLGRGDTSGLGITVLALVALAATRRRRARP